MGRSYVQITDQKARSRGRPGPDGYLYLLTDESDGEMLRLEPI